MTTDNTLQKLFVLQGRMEQLTISFTGITDQFLQLNEDISTVVEEIDKDPAIPKKIKEGIHILANRMQISIDRLVINKAIIDKGKSDARI